MKVGFIGLGRMGQEMAGRILEAGHDLTVYNRTVEKCEALGKAGASIAKSIAEVAANQDVVISMLADDAALEAILQVEKLPESLEKHAIHIAMGTHGVTAMRTATAAHAEHGGEFVAAPVLGRPDAAAAGQLGIVLAGPAAALERATPLFEAMGRRSFIAGDDPASAASIKLANNFTLGCAIEAMGEAFALVRKYGVEPSVFYDVLTDGLFGSPAYKIYGDIIAKEDYDRVGITTQLGLKDCRLAMEAATAVDVPLPSGDVWRDRLEGAIKNGDGEKDWSAVALEQARKSGLA